ncbi:MAG: UvrB/UvrC motif-containing protein, partial [Bacteroidales bacterium]|nr:UvrB/UvrC motif-containing protein [Bacteroidales bacterium]
KDEIKRLIAKTKKDMEAAAKEMDFATAAKLRDEMFELQKML